MKGRLLVALEALLMMGSGAAAASVLWAAYTPDQPPPSGQCIPIYYSGLECCK